MNTTVIRLPVSHIGDRLRQRVEARRAHAALLGDIARALAGAGTDPATSVPRPCPVCLATDAEPAFKAPVYAFHRCHGCSLLYTPRLIRPEVVRARYRDTAPARAYWRYMRADAETGGDGEVYAALLDPLLALVPRRGAAIDVGCGFGRMVAALRPRFDEAIGLELDPPTAAAAARIFAVDVRVTRLQDLDCAPASVDLIVFNEVLEHIAELGSLLSAAYRLLRPGGVIFVRVPHGDSLGLQLLGGGHPSVATHMHINMFTAPALRELARATGFVAHALRCDDALDVPAGDWALPVAKLAGALARRWRLPSRLGRGAHLELIATKAP